MYSKSRIFGKGHMIAMSLMGRVLLFTFLSTILIYCKDDAVDEIAQQDEEEEPVEEDPNEELENRFEKLKSSLNKSSTLFGVSPESDMKITEVDELLEEYSLEELIAMISLTEESGDSLDIEVDFNEIQRYLLVNPVEKLEENKTYKLAFGEEVTDVEGRASGINQDTTYYATEITTGSWEVIYGAEEGTYFGVTCTDSETCYVVGTEGTISKTTDGGDTWEELTSGTTEVLYDVHFVDSEIGYVVGDHGTVLKTIDAGTTWTDISVDGDYFVRAVSAAPGNADRVIVVGDPGNVYISNDGGTNWEGYSTPTATVNRAVLMTSSEQAWIGSDFGIVVNGQYNDDPDAFRPWNLNDEIQLVSDEYLFNTLMFEGFESVNASTVFSTGSNPYKLNGEIQWRCCSDLDDDGKADDTTFYYNADADGFLDHDESNFADEFEFRIFKTENSGADWTMKLTGEGALKGVSFASENVGYFTGFNRNEEGRIVQTLLKTIDGGETFLSQTYPLEDEPNVIGLGAFFKAFAISDEKLIVVGYDQNTADSTETQSKRAAIFITENGAGL